MNVGTITQDRFNWRLPIYAAVAALIAAVPLLIWGNDILELLNVLLLIALLILGALWVLAWTFLGRHRWRKSLSIAAMLTTYWAASAAAVAAAISPLRYDAKWLVHASAYKDAVLKLPAAEGQFRHIEWDGWGFPGAGDTAVYLVFDPGDTLAPAARSDSSVRAAGLPCEVPKVKRMEKRWYVVIFYTDFDWEHCG